VDGWISSPVHEQSEKAETPEQMKAVYAKWAANYDAEMEEHGLQSYHSVIKQVLAHWEAFTYNHTPGTPFQVADLGCGTGLCGQHFVRTIRDQSISSDVRLSGIDISPEMLEKASEKGCFNGNLVQVDLKAPEPVPTPHMFDAIISSGVFYPGHLGPEVIPKMLSILQPGGLFVATMREKMYNESGAPVIAGLVKQASCELVGSPRLMDYYGDIKAYVIVVRKPHS
jgi:predicted TPR repeat methyltransferase